MARGKKCQPEQVVNLLRQIEVAVANGKSTDQACRAAGMRRTHVCMVGTGFSMQAGLPLQVAFTEFLLAPPEEISYPLHPLIAHLGKFIHDAFGHNESAKTKHSLNLEDVFTNKDHAAGHGSHPEARPPHWRVK